MIREDDHLFHTTIVGKARETSLCAVEAVFACAPNTGMTVEGLFGREPMSAGRVALIFFSARTSGEARCTTKINTGDRGS